jgi:aconitate hydratase
MGIVPLEFMPGQSASSLGLDGTERYHLPGLRAAIEDGGQRGGRELEVEVEPDSGPTRRFLVRVRIDTPQEWEYVRHGGILPYVLRQLLGKGMKKL